MNSISASRRLLTNLVGVMLVLLNPVLNGQTFDSGNSPDADALVPAAMGIRTDAKGNSWNVEQNGTIGRIGSTMVNSGLALYIDDEKFVSFQPMMTVDGQEFVLQGRPLADISGLQVQRRIRLLEETGALRYAEMFYNGSTDPISINVALTTNFSGNYKTFLTDRGRTEPVLLQSGESGVVVLPGATQSTRAFLFSLADSESAVKPTISAQNRYGLTFRYPLALAPGETAILIHRVAQVVIPQNFDRRNLSKLFRPYSFAENLPEIPKGWREYLVNSGIDSLQPVGIEPGAKGLASLGIEPGARDILAIGQKTRLLGDAQGKSVKVAGSYGSAELPFDIVAAIVGQDGDDDRSPRLYLRDGQIISAELIIPEFSFLQTGGDKLSLDVQSLDRLILKQSQKDTNWANGTLGMIETFHGDRLKISDAGSVSLKGVTPWGTLPIRLDQLLWLGPAEQGKPGYRVELLNGLSCLVFLEGKKLSLSSPRFGDLELNANELKSVFTPKIQERNHWNTDLGIRDSIHLLGDQIVVGEIGNTSLPIISGGQTIDTSTADIRRIVRLDEVPVSPGGLPEDTPSFQVERWDGGVLSGFINMDSLALSVEGQRWRIPIRDIVRIETPSPELTSDVLATIKQLVEKLSSEDWKTREKATRELGAFGYLARPLLKQELQATTDPEVSHRLERILVNLN